MSTLRLTAAQAVVRYLAAQWVDGGRGRERYFAGVWAIFGHGNVAGLGEALHAARAELPTWRAHNEQAMAHAAIAFAKQSCRRRAMVCTTSIGPGATNMVTAAALAHVNRLPVLFLPGDVFASGRPDPVLQQIEIEADATITANDCFRPVSRRFERITRPEQLVEALPAAMDTLFDPARCGPVTLALCQDTQCEAFDFPAALFESRTWSFPVTAPAIEALDRLEALLRGARAPLFIAGGGVRYAWAEAVLDRFLRAHDLPVAETQAGKGALAWDHPGNLGALGVTGTSAANAAAREADLIVGLGTRLQDFTTGSRALFGGAGERTQLVQVNASGFDAGKHGALAVVGDVAATLEALDARLGSWLAPPEWSARRVAEQAEWNRARDAATDPAVRDGALPSDAQVIGAVERQVPADAIIVCAAGGLPGELHKLWRTRATGGYHVEYGYSCMGYEIAGSLGVKMAEPDREVVVMVGDGSYLMMNSEIATSVMLGLKLVIVVLDNRGFGCIHRLQRATGGAPFNNLLADCVHEALPDIDFAAHAASLGAGARKVRDLAELEAALAAARAADRTQVLVIDTDPAVSTAAGGTWWDVSVPEVSTRGEVVNARAQYDQQLARLRREG
ncbi:MAG: 3D-(3,5/4)-trihydroxycyclohexane-1,2-dione acylhydrolase (decyclizing) [Betaproteobacteria bacterium]|nr:3D-(3,5/4)-trihydroxycyclohexane-1,2-dione acylhydrolase (decyclizing) [Betaproteobacteria bacterium]